MGYSHERGAAVRTILRARAIEQAVGHAARIVVDEAETASSGYLDPDDIDEYADHHAPDGLPADDPVMQLIAERDRYRQIAAAVAEDLGRLQGELEERDNWYALHQAGIVS